MLSRKLDFDILGLALTEYGRIKNRISEKFHGNNHSGTTADTTTGYGHGAVDGGHNHAATQVHTDHARP